MIPPELKDIALHVGEILAAHAVEKNLFARVKHFFYPANYKLRLTKLIISTIDEFERFHPYENSNGKIPFYQSQIFFEHLSNYILFKEGSLDNFKMDNEKYPDVILPSKSELEEFYGSFINKVDSDKLLKLQFINDNYKSKIFEIIKELDSVKSGIAKIISILDDLVIPYRTAFERQFDTSNTNLPFQFNNRFFGRDNKFSILDDFIRNSQKAVIAVVADSGYGKTRFCVEYFKRYIDENDSFIAYVLKDGAPRLPDFTELLKADKRVIVLIDDAHQKKQLLNNLIAEANRQKNVKLILTIRKSVYEETIESIPFHNREIKPLELERLTYEETKAIFALLLPSIHSKEIHLLSEESKGIPILILLLCQIIVNGKYSSELSEETNFIHFVREFKKQIINDIHNKFILKEDKINKTIQLLSIFSPVENSKEELKLISDINEISYEETTQIIAHLSEYDFLSNKTEITIRPDPYKDIIILDSIPVIKSLLQRNDIDVFLDRLITNLVGVEHSKRLDLNIDGIILNFIQSLSIQEIKSFEDEKRLSKNLDTLASFTYKKSKLSINALERLYNNLKDEIDFWKLPKNNYGKPSLKEVHGKIGVIFSIVMLNTHTAYEFEVNFKVLLNYLRLREDFALLRNAFSFRVFNFYEYGYTPIKTCERQLFLVEKIEKIVSQEENSEFEFQLIFSATQLLLDLEFSAETYFNKYTSSYHYGNNFVPYNETTVEIRIRAINVMIKLYLKIRNSEFSKKVLHELLRGFFYTSPPRKNTYEFNQDAEVRLIVKLCNDLLDKNPTIEEKGIILRQLKLFSVKETKEQYQDLIKELIKKLQQDESLKEKLQLIIVTDIYNARDEERKDIDSIISQYKNLESFYTDLLSIMETLKENERHNIHFIIDTLLQKYPDVAKGLFDFVLKNHIKYINYFSTLIKASSKDDTYFYRTIEYCWKLNTEDLRSFVLWALTFGRNNNTLCLKKDDISYFEEEINKEKVVPNWHITNSLAHYISIDCERTLRLLSKVIKIENVRDFDIDSMLRILFEDISIDEHCKIQLKKFAFNDTLHINPNNISLECIYKFLDQNFGFDTLFDYLIKKIDFFKRLENHYLFSLTTFYTSEVENEKKELYFIKALKWYSEITGKPEYLDIQLVKFFKPTTALTTTLKIKVLDLIQSYSPQTLALVNIGSALNVFEVKNEDLLSVLIDISNIVVTSSEYQPEMLTEILESSIFNGQVKSKTGRGAFPQDIAKRELLNSTLSKFEMKPQVREILNLTLSQVNRTIEMDENEDSPW